MDLLAAENSFERAIGAHIVAIRALEDDGWHDVAAALIEKGPLERAAMAEVAAGFIVSEEHAPQASRWLERFFEDDDEFVRRAAVDCFRRLDGTSIAAHRSLYEAYVRSRHFDPDRTYFIHRLENISAAMDDLALDLIEQVVDAARTSDKKNSTGLYQLWDPVFRIYGSSEDNPERLKRSLDLIDLLILHDPVGGDKLRQMS